MRGKLLSSILLVLLIGIIACSEVPEQEELIVVDTSEETIRSPFEETIRSPFEETIRSPLGAIVRGSLGETVSPGATLTESSGLERIKICSLMGGKIESFITYNSTTGEVVSFDSTNDKVSSSSFSIKNNLTGSFQKQITAGLKLKETNLSLSSKNKIFVDLKALNDYGLLIGMETRCRYPE